MTLIFAKLAVLISKLEVYRVPGCFHLADPKCYCGHQRFNAMRQCYSGVTGITILHALSELRGRFRECVSDFIELFGDRLSHL